MKTKTIYIVDDDKDVIFSIIDSLGSLNPDYEFIQASSYDELFIKIPTYRKPDLIILDIMMPEISGLGIAEKIRNTHAIKKVPILFLSARIDEPTQNKIKFYSKYFMEKPYDITELSNKIKEILK